MIRTGDQAPDFSGKSGDGSDLSLKALLSAGPLVLFFYPKDFTPG